MSEMKFGYHKVENDGNEKCYVSYRPWFCQGAPMEEDKIERVDRTSQITEFADKYDLPSEWRKLYDNVPDDYEVNIGKVTLFCFEYLLSHTAIINKYHKDFIDLGCSEGFGNMGWTEVLSWNNKDKKFFIRSDGGSNCYDRNNNFEYYISKYGTETGFHVDKIDKNYQWDEVFSQFDDQNY